MTESTATKVGVPGDKRLGDLKVNKPVPWYGKLPVVRDLKIAVGWQKAMLVTGLVITGVRPVERHPGIRHLHHRGVHPAVLPHHPRRSGAHQGIGLRRVGEGRGRLHMAHHDQAPAEELDAHAARHPYAQLVRGDSDARRTGLPRLRHRADGRGPMGV